MGRFEQRISDDEVAAARTKIAAGASLRSAADEIPCAASTLSVRIRKAEEAEAQARDQARIRADGHPLAQSASEGASLRAIAGREGAAPGRVGPVETLRGAQLATKASGQPDWPTRVAAAKALAALCPEEVEPKKEEPEAQIVVYDLPPGAVPVLHRAREGGAEAPGSPAEAPPEQLPPSDPHWYMFLYKPSEGEAEVIGMWSPASRDQSPETVVTMAIPTTDDPETAERWRAELAVGRLPQTAEDKP